MSMWMQYEIYIYHATRVSSAGVPQKEGAAVSYSARKCRLYDDHAGRDIMLRCVAGNSNRRGAEANAKATWPRLASEELEEVAAPAEPFFI